MKVVAIGSSSTAGVDGIVAYPHRLEMNLRDATKGRMIDVINRGISGQEAPDELKRFDTDVVAEAPSLVIWQVGTNAIFHNDNLDDVAKAIADGLHRLRQLAMDVVLMDLQYLPAMLFDDKADATSRMIRLMADVARDANVDIFKRFALMRHWHVHDRISFEEMTDPIDNARLHQSESSTAGVARALSGAIMESIVSGACGKLPV
ncbi:hypothetical protein BH11PSE4_BH11PSE4_17580 [soil metagenome]